MLAGHDDSDKGFEILRYHYLYNVTNYEDVIFKNAVPEFQEVGPFTYKEVNEYNNIDYDKFLKDPKTGDQRPAIQTNFT